MQGVHHQYGVPHHKILFHFLALKRWLSREATRDFPLQLRRRTTRLFSFSELCEYVSALTWIWAILLSCIFCYTCVMLRVNR